MINLENKNIILTGATGGIGSSIVDTLISLKAKILVTGTNGKKLDELKRKHQNLFTMKQDISIHDELEVFIDNSLGRFKNVFSAAGHPNCIFKISYSQLIKITNGSEKDISE